MFGVVYTDSHWVEGYERSRTNPGHGYPGYTATNEVLKSFKDQDELVEWINVYGKCQKYKVYKLTPVTVKETVSFEINE